MKQPSSSVLHSEDDTTLPPDSIVEEIVDHDDTCPICQLLFYRPVRTCCNHTLCESCMTQWADASITSQMTAVGLDDQAVLFMPHEIEIKCPMCRTLTTANLDLTRESVLQVRYPFTYQERQHEHMTFVDHDFTSTVETLTVYVGNEHSLIRPASDSNNKHQWNFFLRPSRTDLIEEVQIFLHPTFRNSRVILQRPPYEVRRLGWGHFTIYANIILKAGYSWMSSEAEEISDGDVKGKLPLEWTLDFNGRGSQGRLRLKVKKADDGPGGRA